MAAMVLSSAGCCAGAACAGGHRVLSEALGVPAWPLFAHRLGRALLAVLRGLPACGVVRCVRAKRAVGRAEVDAEGRERYEAAWTSAAACWKKLENMSPQLKPSSVLPVGLCWVDMYLYLYTVGIRRCGCLCKCKCAWPREREVVGFTHRRCPGQPAEVAFVARCSVRRNGGVYPGAAGRWRVYQARFSELVCISVL